MRVCHLIQRLLYPWLLRLEILLGIFDLTCGLFLDLLHSPLVSIIKSFLISFVREAISLRKRCLSNLKSRMVIAVSTFWVAYWQTGSAIGETWLISGRHLRGLSEWKQAAALLLDEAILGVMVIVMARKLGYGSFVELGDSFGVFSEAWNTLRGSEICFGWMLWEHFECVESFRSGVIFNLEESIPSDSLLVEINLRKMVGITLRHPAGIRLAKEQWVDFAFGCCDEVNRIV